MQSAVAAWAAALQSVHESHVKVFPSCVYSAPLHWLFVVVVQNESGPPTVHADCVQLLFDGPPLEDRPLEEPPLDDVLLVEPPLEDVRDAPLDELLDEAPPDAPSSEGGSVGVICAAVESVDGVDAHAMASAERRVEAISVR